MGRLLVVTGPPGAGKSTVARLLADRSEPSVLVEGDAFFGFLARGAIEPWRAESNDQNTVVIRAAAAAAGRFAADYDTVYDGVIGPWFLPTFAGATGRQRLDYVVLLPSVDTCVERVATRAGHGFDDEPATRQMHDEFARSDIDPRHVLVEDSAPPDVIASMIDEAASGGQLVYGS